MPRTAKRPQPLPPAVFHLLLALRDGEQHGYALMQRVEELTDGAVRMGPGTLYGAIKRMLADGLIEETTDRVARTGNERRRYYRLTANGRLTAVDELTRLQHLVHLTAGHLPGAAAT